MGNWNRRREPRVGICLHFDGSLSDAGAVDWLTKDKRCNVSYNWIVLDDGTVVDIAPEDARAWHAGVCKPGPGSKLQYKDANSALYGIAVAAKEGDQATQVQLDAVVDLCRRLFQKERWPVSDEWRITSHRAEAWPRGRKSDCEGQDPTKAVLDPVVVRKLLFLES